jgi:tripartite-type tricarboxylate transporter receptor subunit TctC
MRSRSRSRRELFAGFIACASLATSTSIAQTYPAKPIRLIVGYTTGGPTDTTARMVAQKLSEHIGQPVIVENRAGASGTLGKERVASSPPDGYTLLVMSSGDAIVQALMAKTPRDLELGFAPVTLAATGTYVLVVHPSVPVRNVRELIALARSKPGKLTYGSSGIGSSVHLAGELLNVKAGLKMVHVPYKSSADSARATASGEVELSFPGIPGALPFLYSKRIKALAVTSKQRVAMMADTPTLNESGVPGYDRYGWYGVLAPSGTPKDIVARLTAAISDVVNIAEMKAALNQQGLEPKTNTPEQFAAFIQGEIAENAKLIKLIGLKAE